jgi:hypothetical protein
MGALADGARWDAASDESEDRSLPFYPVRDELAVLHNNQTVIEDVRCVS